MSFKEYLESKKQLLKTIAECPIQSLSYDVTKYCRLMVGERDSKKAIPLKPGQTLIIEWQYQNVEDSSPVPTSIRFDDVKFVDPLEEFSTPWKPQKLAKWLSKNAVEV